MLPPSLGYEVGKARQAELEQQLAKRCQLEGSPSRQAPAAANRAPESAGQHEAYRVESSQRVGFSGPPAPG